MATCAHAILDCDSRICAPGDPLPPSVDAFRESLPRGLRRNLKRYGIRLTRDASVEFRTVTDPVEVPQVLEALFELHAERWRERGGPGIFASAEVRDFHRRAAPALHHEGLLRLHCLIVDDTIAGIVYVIADRGRACSYIGGFDPALNRYSPGSLLLAYPSSTPSRRAATHTIC